MDECGMPGVPLDGSDADEAVALRGVDPWDIDGVSAFDGTTWDRYLSDLVGQDMAVGPDGSLWVIAGDDLYVIRPAGGEHPET